MKNEEFNRLDKLVKSKAYTDLNAEDREWINEEVGADAYKELSILASSISGEKEKTIRKQVKSDLIKTMKRKHRGVLATTLGYRTPMYANVMALLLLVTVAWFVLPAKEVIIEKLITINVPVVDTVTIQLPSDTVFIERKVRVEVPIYLTKTAEPSEAIEKRVKDKPFAEDKALQDLLVSGQ